MANTEIFLRNIFGTTRPNIRPLVLALNITNDLLFEQLHMPPQKCSLTADDGASPPPEWCTASAEMVHGGR